jgi:thiamine-monophosphate kinase
MANILILYQFIQIFVFVCKLHTSMAMSDLERHDDEIASLGEFGLIRHLTREIRIINSSTCVGIGDDAAVLDYGGSRVVVTTDLLAEGIHFNLVYTPLKHLGYKAAVVNFSDIYAMNAQPRQLLVSMAISRKFTLSMMETLYSGIRLACEQYGVDLVGGDTTSSLTGLIISCTVVGEGKEQELTFRKGAGIHDLICVSGDLGGAYLGLQLLERERILFEKHRDLQPVLEGYDYTGTPAETGSVPNITTMFRESGHPRPDRDGWFIRTDAYLPGQAQVAGSMRCNYYRNTPGSPRFTIDPVVAAPNEGKIMNCCLPPASSFDKIGKRPETIIGHMADISEGVKIIASDGGRSRLRPRVGILEMTTPESSSVFDDSTFGFRTNL